MKRKSEKIESKKERTYWGVSESKLDKDLTNKIQKKEQLLRYVSLACTLCNILFLLLICFRKNLSDTATIVCSVIVIILGLCEITISIATAVNLKKLKKEALTTKKEPDESSAAGAVSKFQFKGKNENKKSK